MNKLEIISQTNIGEPREVDGQLQSPLEICSAALTTPFSHKHYPLAIFSLAGAVSRSQPNLHKITLVRALEPDGIVDYVRAGKPDVLALSSPQGTLATLDQTLACLAQFPLEERPVIILGSSLPSYLSERFFDRYPELPMTIIGGWGEDAFVEEVRAHSIGKTKAGPIFIHGTYPKDYPRQEGIPQNDGVIKFHYPRVEASRGCYWGTCSFCLRPWGEKRGIWEQYDPKDVLSQITDILRLGYTNYFEFTDEEPLGNNIDRFREIMEGLLRIKRDHPTLTFGINMRADHVVSPQPKKQEQYDEFLRIAKAAGLVMVWMGAESYSHSHLQAFNKGAYITPDINLKAAEKLDRFGIGVLQGFIPYHPLSTWQELAEMADFMRPHIPFLARVISSPFGFLRVQYSTPYVEAVKKVETITNEHLLHDLDENMLTYHCRYRDPSIGLHVAYMRLVYDWINPFMKQLNVEALKGDESSRDKLNRLRSVGLRLFVNSIQRSEPLKEDLSKLEEEQLKAIGIYKREVDDLGIDGIDVREFDEFMRKNLAEYIDRFL